MEIYYHYVRSYRLLSYLVVINFCSALTWFLVCLLRVTTLYTNAQLTNTSFIHYFITLNLLQCKVIIVITDNHISALLPEQIVPLPILFKSLFRFRFHKFYSENYSNFIHDVKNQTGPFSNSKTCVTHNLENIRISILSLPLSPSSSLS